MTKIIATLIKDFISYLFYGEDLQLAGLNNKDAIIRLTTTIIL